MPKPDAPSSSSSSLPLPYATIASVEVAYSQLKAQDTTRFTGSLTGSDPVVAVSAAYGSHQKLEWLMFLNSEQTPLLIRFGNKRLKTNRPVLSHFLDQLVLKGVRLIAYGADKLAASLFLECGVRLTKCYNVQTMKPRSSLDTFNDIMSLCQRANFNLKRSVYDTLFNDRSKREHRAVSLLGRAWFALLVARLEEKAMSQARWIDTKKIPEEVRNHISHLLAPPSTDYNVL